MGRYLRLIVFLKDIKMQVAFKILMGLSITATYMCQAMAIAHGVAAVFNRDGSNILFYLGIIAACIGARGLLMWHHEGYTKKMAAKLKHGIRQKIVDKLMALGVGYQNDKRSGNLQSLVTDGVESFEAFLANYVPQVFVVLIALVAVVAYLCSMNPVVGLVVFVSVVLSIVLPHITMPFVSRTTVEYWQTYAVLNSQYIDAMQGMNVLKAFNASGQKRKELAKDSHDFFEDSMRNTTFSLIDSAVIILFMVIGSSVAICIAAWYTSRGIVSPTQLAVMLFLISECIRPINELNNYWHASYLGFSVAEEFFNVLDLPVPIQDKTDSTLVIKDLPEVTFQNVSFKYGETNEEALNNVSFTLKRGQTTAVVGKSGSGKSTIANLLLRFYDVSKGAILLDGHPIKDYSLAYLRSKISVVFQDTYLFYGTVKENIAMAKPEATMEEIEEAARLASAHSFIWKLPQGYDTIVGERGATLSGGEKQRIAIARAVLKDAPLLILDEATSSVDGENEHAIQHALDKLMQGRTTMVIAHRLSTIRHMQNILVLEDGCLRELGNHHKLMDRQGAYYHLIHAQEKAGRVS